MPGAANEYDGAPAYELYCVGVEELNYQLEAQPRPGDTGRTRVSTGSFETVRVALERAASAEALSLEKGMIILSTAVAGGPFIGLLGTVWGVMETFSGIARANAASLTAMAPGVAGALIATVAGLFVAIPAMFAYNYMVTTIRAITQELDGFASEFATQLEHQYVDNRPLATKSAMRFRDALKAPADREASPLLDPRRLQDLILIQAEHEKVFQKPSSRAGGVEHHAAAGPGVCAAGHFHHHHHSRS